MLTKPEWRSSKYPSCLGTWTSQPIEAFDDSALNSFWGQSGRLDDLQVHALSANDLPKVCPKDLHKLF